MFKHVKFSGLPVIDQLNGGATSGRGCQSEHEIRGNIRLAYKGVGFGTETTWESATRVNGALGGASTLRFGMAAV